MSSSFIRRGGLAAMTGGVLWALTPLREPLLGGRFPGDPVFRPYNFVLLVIAVLLAVGLLAFHARYRESYGRLGMAGVLVTFGGYALLFFGSLPAVLFSSEGLRGLVRVGQDLGFLGALVAGVGALLLGVALRKARAVPRGAALLLVISLPIGLVGTTVMASVGLEDTAGLPLTVLYGGAWAILGYHLRSEASTTGRQPSRVI